jgi:hypothetical protein
MESVKDYDVAGGGHGVLWKVQFVYTCPAIGHFRVWPLMADRKTPIEAMAGNIACWPLPFDPIPPA